MVKGSATQQLKINVLYVISIIASQDILQDMIYNGDFMLKIHSM